MFSFCSWLFFGFIVNIIDFLFGSLKNLYKGKELFLIGFDLYNNIKLDKLSRSLIYIFIYNIVVLKLNSFINNQI